MWPCGDDYVEMKVTLHITDEVVEAVVWGEPVADVYAPLVAFAELVGLVAGGPVPGASLVLEDLFGGRMGLRQFRAGTVDGVAVGRPGGRSGRKRMPVSSASRTARALAGRMCQA